MSDAMEDTEILMGQGDVVGGFNAYAPEMRDAMVVAVERREELRLRAEAREKELAELDSRSGEGVRAVLAGAIGQRIVDVLALKKNRSAASKVLARMVAEEEELEQLKPGTRDAEFVSRGWDAAVAKTRVPEILRATMRFDQAEQPHVHILQRRMILEDHVKALWSEKNYGRLIETLDEVDDALRVEASEVLEIASGAYSTLIAATGDVDDIELVIEDGQAETMAAFKAWRTAVARWVEFQSVRQWLAFGTLNGFDPKSPENVSTYVPGSTVDIKVLAWRGQFEAGEVEPGTVTVALQGWCALDPQSRPAPSLSVKAEEGSL